MQDKCSLKSHWLAQIGKVSLNKTWEWVYFGMVMAVTACKAAPMIAAAAVVVVETATAAAAVTVTAKFAVIAAIKVFYICDVIR